MRKYIMMIMCMLMAGCAFANENYPALGTCTGDAVRLREAPNTSSKILGKVNDSQPLVLLGERRVKSEIWYHIDNPLDDGEAWISGRYVEKNEEFSPAFRTGVTIRLNFGTTPKKMRMIFGRPSDSEKGTFFFDPAQKNYTREILTYPGFTASFTEGRLTRVEVSKKGYSFGEIEVGTEIQTLLDTLGKPSVNKDNRYIYELSPIEELTFSGDGRKTDRVIRMVWEQYIDG